MDKTGLFELLEQNCMSCLESTAVVNGTERLSYAELLAQIDSFGNRLASLGVKKGSHVTLLFRNSSNMLCLYLALLKMGALTSPLNYRENAEELGKLAADIDSELLIYGDNNTTLAAKMKETGNFKTLSESEFLKISTESAQTLDTPSENDIVLNIFTGGTTGIPKAASHTYGNLTNQILSCYEIEVPIRNDDVILNYAPMFHIGGFTLAMQTLCAAATLIISEVFDSERLLNFVAKEKITQLSLIPPSLCSELVKCDNYCAEKLSSVRLVRVSGGACTLKNVGQIFKIFPKAKVLVGYGMSERAINMVNIINRDSPIHEINGCISVGKPGMRDKCRLVDETGATVSTPLTVGEAYGKSSCMMSGYYKHNDSFDKDGWYATGDLMCFDAAGYYYFMDRKKDMIKSGGENVYSNHIEQIINSHPAVSECAVVGIPSEKFGETVAAAVVLKKGAEATEQDIKDYCGERAAGFKKARRIIFVEKIPHSKIGKIKKSEVRLLFKDENNG